MVNAIIQKLTSFYQKHYSIEILPKAVYFFDDVVFVCFQNENNLPLIAKQAYKEELKVMIEWATGRQVRAIYNDIIEKTNERADIFVFNPEHQLSAGPNYLLFEDEEEEWEEDEY
jgi:hypothetical protein